MALTRRGRGRRDANEAEIVAALKAAGCTVVHLDDPADLLVGRNGVNYLIEVKNPATKGKMRKSQVEFAESWGGQYAVVESVEQALEAIEPFSGYRQCECASCTSTRRKYRR